MTVKANYIQKIILDSRKRIWISSINDLELFDRKEGTFRNYRFVENDTNCLPPGEVVTIFEDSEKNLWIGTKGGLSNFNYSTGIFKNYFQDDGMAGNSALGILEDSNKNLWISTNNGLSKFIKGATLPDTAVFKNFNKITWLHSTASVIKFLN